MIENKGAWNTTSFSDVWFNTGLPYVMHGHGTAVAGIIAGYEENIITGDILYIGVMPMCHLHITKISKNTFFSFGKFLIAYYYTVYNVPESEKSNIINLSWVLLLYGFGISFLNFCFMKISFLFAVRVIT